MSAEDKKHMTWYRWQLVQGLVVLVLLAFGLVRAEEPWLQVICAGGLVVNLIGVGVAYNALRR